MMRQRLFTKSDIAANLQGLIGAVFLPSIFSSVGIFFFAPVLARSFISHPFKQALIHALIAGLFMDCISSALPFGTEMIVFCFLTLLLFRFKRHFFSDKLLSFALFTAIISIMYTIVTYLLFTLNDQPVNFLWKSLISDFAIMPVIDAVYALIWFSLPKFLVVQTAVKMKAFHVKKEPS
jgi:rod shape-determining protein MreD